eukprot:m.429685 g.429685  ORF g.429685 m.429685 type:complete len:132 (-) comp21387_c0_seq21:3750-4145(-)
MTYSDEFIDVQEDINVPFSFRNKFDYLRIFGFSRTLKGFNTPACILLTHVEVGQRHSRQQRSASLLLVEARNLRHKHLKMRQYCGAYMLTGQPRLNLFTGHYNTIIVLTFTSVANNSQCSSGRLTSVDSVK